MLGATSFQQAVTATWSPAAAGQRFATGTLDGGAVGFDENEASLVVHDVNLHSGSLVNVKELRIPGARFASLRWGGQDGSLIAGGMTDGSVRLWNCKGRDLYEAGHVVAHEKGTAVKALSFNPTVSNQIAHGGADKKLFVLDITTGASLKSVAVTDAPTQHQGEIVSTAWNYETAHILASSSMDGVCSVWDIRSKKSFSDIRDPRSASTVVVCWSPKSGFHMVTGSDSGYIRLFDLRSSKSTPLAEFQAHGSGVFDVAWCPQDPGYLASCGKDNKLVVWDLYTLQPIQEISSEASQTLNQASHGFALDRPGPALGFGGGGGQLSADALFSGAPATSGAINFGVGTGSASARRYQIQWSPTVPGLLTACSFDRTVQLLSLITNASGGQAGNQNLRAPAWMGRRSGVSFAFGGRLVSFGTSLVSPGAAGGKPQPEVEVKNCHGAFGESGETAASRMAEFEHRFNQAVQHDAGPSHDHLAAFCAEQASRCTTAADMEIWKFMRILFEEENARVAVQKYLGYDEEAVARGADLSLLPPADDHLEDLTSADNESSVDDDSGATPEDELIIRSLTVGNFEAAVALCFQHGRAADALVLSSLGGTPLMKRAHKAYLRSEASRKRRVMRLARVIFQDSAQTDLVRTADLQQKGSWQQTLAFLMTYTRPEDFAAQCDALASRLEHEPTGSGGGSDLVAAAVCYMLSRNVEKSADLWTRLNPRDDVALVEKAVVFQRVLPNPAALQEDRVMMQRVAKLAAKLVDEGEFGVAAKYAEMARTADFEADDLVQRIEYGLRWTAESETRAREAEEQQQQALLEQQRIFEEQQQQQQQQQQQPYTNGGYNQTTSAYGHYTDKTPSDNFGVQTSTYNSFVAANHGTSNYGSQPPHSGYISHPDSINYAQSSGYGFQPPSSHGIQAASTGFAPAASTSGYGTASVNQPSYGTPATQPNAYNGGSYQSSFAPPTLQSYAAPPQAPNNSPGGFAAPATTNTYGTSVIAPPTSFSAAPTAPPVQSAYNATPAVNTNSGVAPLPPRVKENDGFGSTAGIPEAGAKYGNRPSFGGSQPVATSGATPTTPQVAPPKPAKIPDSMMPALQSIHKLLTALKARYPSGMEERRLKEAEKGEEILRSALAIGSLSDFFLAKLREMAAAFDRGAIAEAHNIHIALSSSVDWKEHKEWLKRLGHLIAVAQKDSQPQVAQQTVPPPSSLPPPTASYATGPPSTGGGNPPSYGAPASTTNAGYGVAAPVYGGPPQVPGYGQPQQRPPVSGSGNYLAPPQY